MATFLTDLVNSIFTPGPTPPLLLATNVTFAALQLLLITLLAFTHSIHFLVLSFLSAGLWWAINWFAAEVRAAAAAEADKKRKEEERGRAKPRETSEGTEESGYEVDSGEGTEMEQEDEKGVEEEPAGARSAREETPTLVARTGEERGFATGSKLAPEQAGRARGGDGGAKKRQSLAKSTGSVSTDSEWEKVDT